MSFHFYFSYAPADYSEDLRGFFEDLTCVVRVRLGLSGEEQVGFFDPLGSAPGSEWRPEVADALRTSQTMLAMVSPEYVQSDSAGKEWQLFETRRYLPAVRGEAETKLVIPPAIAPVTWIPCNRHMPKVISEAQSGLGQSNGAYSKNGLLLVRQKAEFQDEYANLLRTLAEQIVGMAGTAELPLLDVLPPLDEVPNALRFQAVVVEGHKQVREMLVEYLHFCNFEAKGYSKADGVIQEILADKRQMTKPDLFVIDLEFEAEKRQGLNLIEWLTYSKVPSAIMATSATLSNLNLIEAIKMGAEDVVPKPFDVRQTVERMKNLAGISRKRRMYRQRRSSSVSTDPLRQKRPVFLSYSNKDNQNKRVASFLRSHIEAAGIGVWYADDTLQAEDPVAAEQVFNGIGEAHVYLPLITDSYPASTFCWAEFARFCNSAGTDPSRTLLPVLHSSPEEIENFEWIRPIIDEYECADIRSERFLDGLIALLGRIQQAINRNEPP